MKNALPPNAKISKDAKEVVQECVSEFISFITSEAAEKCLLEKRKTVGGEDIIYAMQSLGFGDYAAVLRIYLAKLREVSSMFPTSPFNLCASAVVPSRYFGRIGWCQWLAWVGSALDSLNERVSGHPPRPHSLGSGRTIHMHIHYLYLHELHTPY